MDMFGFNGEDGKCVCCCNSLKNKICRGLSDLLLKFVSPFKISFPNWVKLSSCSRDERGSTVNGVPWAWLRWAEFRWIRQLLIDSGSCNYFYWFDGRFLGILFHLIVESLGTIICFKLLLVLLDVYFLMDLCILICLSIAMGFRRNVAWTIFPSNSASSAQWCKWFSRIFVASFLILFKFLLAFFRLFLMMLLSFCSIGWCGEDTGKSFIRAWTTSILDVLWWRGYKEEVTSFHNRTSSIPKAKDGDHGWEWEEYLSLFSAFNMNLVIILSIY